MKSRAVAFLLLAISVLTGCGLESAPPVGALERGKTHFRNGQWPQAMEAFNEAIASDPNKPEAYVLRGRTRIVQGNVDRAIADYTNAIRIDPKHEEGYLNRAVAYRELAKNRPADAKNLIELANQDQIAAGKLDPAYQHRVEAFARRQLLAEQAAAEDAARQLKAQRDRTAQHLEEQRSAEGLEGNRLTGRGSQDATRRTRGLGDPSDESLDGRSRPERTRGGTDAGDDLGRPGKLRDDRSTRNLKDRYGQPVEIDLAGPGGSAGKPDEKNDASEPGLLDDQIAEEPADANPADVEQLPGLGSTLTRRRSTFESRTGVRRANNLSRDEGDKPSLPETAARLSPDVQSRADSGKTRAADAQRGTGPQAGQQERRAYYGNPFDATSSETGRPATPFSEPAATPFTRASERGRGALGPSSVQPLTPFNTPATTPFSGQPRRERPESLGSSRPLGPRASLNAPAATPFNSPAATPFSAPGATPFSSPARTPFSGPPVDTTPDAFAPTGAGPFE